MFTGLITDIGTVRDVEQRGDLRLVIGCGYDPDSIPLGASIACSGACLTVIDRGGGADGSWFAVDVSAETVARTAAGLWQAGSRLNLERALRVGDELGGHIVAGHVDAVATLVGSVQEGDSLRLTFDAPREVASALAPKGSVALDGVSLTVNEVADHDAAVRFGVNLILHTASHTTLGNARPGRELNLEIDLLARYLDRMLSVREM